MATRLPAKRSLIGSGLALSLVVAGQVALGITSAAAATSFSVTTTADVAANSGACGNPSIVIAPSPLSLREAVCLANNIGGTVDDQRPEPGPTTWPMASWRSDSRTGRTCRCSEPARARPQSTPAARAETSTSTPTWSAALPGRSRRDDHRWRGQRLRRRGNHRWILQCRHR